MSGRWWECPADSREQWAVRLLAGCPRHRVPLVEHRWVCPVDKAVFGRHQNICTQHNERLVEVEGEECPGGNSKPSKPTTNAGSSTSGPTGRSPAPSAGNRSHPTRRARVGAGSAASTGTSGPATGGAASANPSARSSPERA